jgi:hypothetical protein
MEIASALVRRMATVNRKHHPLIQLKSVTQTDSGGLHVVVLNLRKRVLATGRIFIPNTMVDALRTGRKNLSLDNKLKI